MLSSHAPDGGKLRAYDDAPQQAERGNLLFAHLGRVIDQQVDHDVACAGLEEHRHVDRLLRDQAVHITVTERFWGGCSPGLSGIGDGDGDGARVGRRKRRGEAICG